MSTAREGGQEEPGWKHFLPLGDYVALDMQLNLY